MTLSVGSKASVSVTSKSFLKSFLNFVKCGFYFCSIIMSHLKTVGVIFKKTVEL